MNYALDMVISTRPIKNSVNMVARIPLVPLGASQYSPPVRLKGSFETGFLLMGGQPLI